MSDRRMLTSDSDLEQLTNVFKLLSDRTRLQILIMLADGERNVSSLCDSLDLPQPTVSHHLGLLRMSNIIENRRSGKQVFYSLNGRLDVADRKSLQIQVDRFRIGIAPSETHEPVGAE